MVGAYYRLTKPGIIYGNALSATAGFLLASRGDFDLWLFLAMLVGISLVMAAACVFNNIIDRDIDSKMERTRTRATAAGTISIEAALFYATSLGILGFYLLFFYTTLTAGLLAMVGFFFYVGAYSVAKRKSVHGTLVGSVSGATPPVVGYSAVTAQLDTAALLLFAILVFWQMPHFYAIAMFRIKDYRRAGLPVLPVVRGAGAAKTQIIIYILLFIVATAGLFIFSYTGYVYLTFTGLFGLVWLQKAWQGLKSLDDELWARQLFKFSLVVLLTFCLATSFDSWLP